MREWQVTLWVDGFDGELTTVVTARNQEMAEEAALEQLDYASADVTGAVQTGDMD